MLNMHISFRRHRSAHAVQRQSGVVMMVALIVLVVMTLAGIALMRSMDTTNLIAGNMAFKQAATQSADNGVETAIAWLETSNVAGYLDDDHADLGYFASSPSNAGLKLGEKFWADLEKNGVCNMAVPVIPGVCSKTPDANASGNQISYMIHRLCRTPGNRNDAATACSVVTGTLVVAGNNEGANDEVVTGTTSSSYYRITVRVVGPRNSVSFVQAIVSM